MSNESQDAETLLELDFCACAKSASRASLRRFGPNAERGAGQREIWKEAMSSTSTKTPSLFGRFWALSWKMKLISLALVPVVLLYAGALLLSLFNYAVGERTGVLSKISKKGVACWTMEGELAQPSFSKSGALRSEQRADRQHFLFLRAGPECPQAIRRRPAGSLRVPAI